MMIETPNNTITDTSGCGDAFISGFVTALMRDKTMKQSLVCGQAAAAINARSMSSVNRDEISYYSVKDFINEELKNIEIVEKTI